MGGSTIKRTALLGLFPIGRRIYDRVKKPSPDRTWSGGLRITENGYEQWSEAFLVISSLRSPASD